MAKTELAVRDLDDAELLERLAETKEELFNLRFQHVTGPARQLRPAAPARKRDIARINTELREPRDRRRRGAGDSMTRRR